MVSVFLCLPALRNSSRESFDAGQVRYPVVVLIEVSREAIFADVQAHQCPDGGYGRCSMDGAGVSGICNRGTDSAAAHRMAMR